MNFVYFIDGQEKDHMQLGFNFTKIRAIISCPVWICFQNICNQFMWILISFRSMKNQTINLVNLVSGLFLLNQY